MSDSYIWTPVHKLNHLIWSFWGDFSFSNFWLAAYPNFTHLSKPNVPQSQGQKWNIAVSPDAKSHWAFKPNSAALCCLLCQNKYSSWRWLHELCLNTTSAVARKQIRNAQTGLIVLHCFSLSFNCFFHTKIHTDNNIQAILSQNLLFFSANNFMTYFPVLIIFERFLLSFYGTLWWD